MCRAKDDVRGEWRCTPNQSFLDEYRGHYKDDDFRIANGAFWFTTEVPSLEEIHLVRDDTLARWESGILQVEDISHIGHMIAMHSDAKISNFNSTLINIQNQAIEYDKFLTDGITSRLELRNKYKSLMNNSLSFGLEVRENLVKILYQIRDFSGENPVQEEMNSLDYYSIARETGKLFPTQWKHAISGSPVLIVDSMEGGRADFSPATNEIVMGDEWNGHGKTMHGNIDTAEKSESIFMESKEDAFIVITHEFGHKYEVSSPTLLAACAEFQERRCVVGENNQKIYLGSEDDKWGISVADHFADDYVGRFYPDRTGKTGAIEVFSMGMEHTFLGSGGSLIGLPTPSPSNDSQVLFYRADPDHRNLILGSLALLDM